jgi:hypothetical protein
MLGALFLRDTRQRMEKEMTGLIYEYVNANSALVLGSPQICW